TALHHAAANGHETTVELLVKTLGADKEAKDGNNCTALHHAAAKGHDMTVELLVKTLGADMEVKNRMGWASLHLAVIRGDESTMRLLAICGANIESEDIGKRTALHWAAMFGHKTTVQLL
ncbi:ankyrin, partial [Wilcoxina mikolae CBS 423.85]